MHSPSPRLLSMTLYSICLVQTVLGVSFLFAPGPVSLFLGFTRAPEWTDWMFGFMAARFLGFAWGMWIAARDPLSNRPWIVAMMVIQAVDWVLTLRYLASGTVTLQQVTTASFLPLLFIIGLATGLPRSRPVALPAAETGGQREQ